MSVVEPDQLVLAQAARGHRRILLAQALKLGCKLVSVLLLARLVTPVDHGLFAMASSVILLLTLFRDAGLGVAAVQARELNETQLTTLFWAHLGLGAALAIVTLGVAPLAARFYNHDAITPLLALMSVAFLLIGAGGFARSQLERASRFGEISWIEGSAAVAGTLAMIAAALADAGAYSFVAYLLVSEFLATAFAWRAWRWRPRGTPRWSSVRGLLHTGADVTVYQLMAYFVQQIDAIFVGRLFGAHAMGLYNRANQMLALPNLYVASPLNQVALVTLSRLGFGSGEFVRHAHTTATVIAHLILPLFAIAAVLPEESVRLVLGAQWPEAAPLLRLLSLAAAAATITALGYAINVAAGQTRRLVISAAIALPLTVTAVWLGASKGPLGVAAGIAIVNILLVVPRLWWALRGLPGGLPAYLRALQGPVVAALVAAGGLWLGGAGGANFNWGVRLGVGLLGGVAALVSLSILWPRVRQEWRTVVSYLPLPWQREKVNSP